MVKKLRPVIDYCCFSGRSRLRGWPPHLTGNLKGDENCMSRRRTKKSPQSWNRGTLTKMRRFARKAIKNIRGYIEAKLSEVGNVEVAIERLTPKGRE